MLGEADPWTATKYHRTLYLLILKTLARHGELHGFEIADSIQRTTENVLQVEEARSPHAPAHSPQRLGHRRMGHPAGNRRARCYKITAAGRKQLAREIYQFDRVISAIHGVIGSGLN